MINEVFIQDKRIADNSDCFIIAEAGVNHNGDLKLALRLIEEAKAAGADCIKFQTFSTDYCESQYSLKPTYFRGRDSNQTKLDFSRSLEFNKEEFKILKDYCDELDIIFLSMAADIPSLEILLEIGTPAIKIGSSDTLNFPLFKYIGQTKLPVIYSTGISSLEDVEQGIQYLRETGVNQIAIMQCTSQYPAPIEDINLMVMDTYKSKFNLPVGLSDHSKGLHIPYAAVARGAKIIEKHFTLNRNLPGVDHIASIEPHELKELVNNIREIEKAIGDGVKTIKDSEVEHLNSMRKSLFTLKEIKKGETFTLENIGAKRPGGGIVPIEIDKILGRIATKNIRIDEFLEWDMVSEDEI